MKKLLTVEDAFVTRGSGVLVMPRFTADTPPPPSRFAVRLKLPDGTERDVFASVEVSHIRGQLAPWAMYRLDTNARDLTPDDVPIGTEIWSIGDGE